MSQKYTGRMKHLAIETLNLRRRVAQGLTQLGVGPGDRVGFWLPNIKAYIGLLGACGHLGAIAVAMNTRFRKAEIEDVIRRVEPKVIAFVSNIGAPIASIL